MRCAVGAAYFFAMGCLASASASVTGPSQTPSIFNPASTPAHDIYHLSLFVMAICLAIFLVVFSLIVYAAVKFRRRGTMTMAREPPQIYGSNQVELAWTVIPILIVVVLFLAAARVIHAVEDAQLPCERHRGHRRRPSVLVGVSISGLRLHHRQRIACSGQRSQSSTPTHIILLSADTDHSFWVPQLAGKTDLIPNHKNEMWVDPHETGTYVGQCAQYCGVQHAKMLLRVMVESPEDFQKWVTAAEESGGQCPIRWRAGRQVFESNACVNCHTIAGTEATWKVRARSDAPDEPRYHCCRARRTNTQENLRLWVKEPDAIKPGCLMPAMQLERAGCGCAGRVSDEPALGARRT